MLCFAASLVAVQAQGTQTFSASAVKAAYLVNFAKFTTWPNQQANPQMPLVIGVADDREVEEFLFKLIAGQKIQEHPLRVRRVMSDSDLAGCHIVYFGDVLAGDLVRMIETIANGPVLTVSSAQGFLEKGGMVGFYSENKNLRFEIDSARTAESGLVLSSRLLALARSNPQRAR
ncbi:MAG: YfiR family protein [Opitutaceae bacterium]|nr:YfiR family protein [Opitutaceae bacterium]